MKFFESSAFGRTTGTKFIIMQATTIFGELITTEIKQDKTFGFLVFKYIDGQLRSSYPAKSLGKAKKVERNILA